MRIPSPNTILLKFAAAWLFIALVSLWVVFVTGCNTAGDLALPRAPAWVQPGDARTLTGGEVAAQVRQILPATKLTGLSDRTFTLVSHDWLKAYVAWTWQAARTLGITYTPESFDCENFATAFNNVVALKASQAGLKSAPLVAAITVQTSGTSLHALVGVATDKGIFIVEPQPDAGPFRIWPLADYDKPILAIELGLASPF